jgi:CRISPR-associated protein Cmr2
VSKIYWQAKIWGLLHDPALKSLSSGKGFAREGQWDLLKCMEGWKSPKQKGPSRGEFELQGEWLKYIGLCDLISSASDRSTIGRLDPKFSAVTYKEDKGLQIRHLLSGEPLDIFLNDEWQQKVKEKKQAFLEEQEIAFLDQIKDWDDPKTVFWALWRCYPEFLEKKEPLIHLLPAETRLPDASLWSHVSMTSALAGGLAGYYKNSEDYPQKSKSFNNFSRPYLVNFTFSPVQELIKSSRKIRDFWAGSWILHYLSAKVCMAIANQYGPDSLLYPCLYQQPLIDQWLLKQYPDFKKWLQKPETSQLLTAGFPNVIIMILPNNNKSQDDVKDNPVFAATQLAKQTLIKEWKELGNKSLEFLQNQRGWPKINPSTWEDWLNTQWQTYWTAFPIGNPEEELHCSLRTSKNKDADQVTEIFEKWCEAQGEISQPRAKIFETNEEKFLKEIFRLTDQDDDENNESEKKDNKQFNESKYSKQPNLNVGSWWAPTFDQLRISLNAIKNARTWEISTAFAVRSSISGIGPAVHPLETESGKLDWPTEKEVAEFWKKHCGLFDGSEKLNATEVIKRVLHQLLPDLLQCSEENIDLAYPDLSAGVAGYLKTCLDFQKMEAVTYYQTACKEIKKKIPDNYKQTLSTKTQAWGIPFIDQNTTSELSSLARRYHPRFLNVGWLVEDQELNKTDIIKEYRKTLSNEIDRHYPNNNPTDWYVIAAGDGDSMGDWLRGEHLKKYENYLADSLREKIESVDQIPEKYREPLQAFLKVKKRMGPSTHSALSRALLDFSNQLVPYLTEQRYAGRLIYSGGDDVLAYTNLWEWDSWLWDVRQCFKGDKDPKNQFDDKGDYWRWKNGQAPEGIAQRPLFTMGQSATISFGLVIAHHSVPLAIALENLWEAEEKAKEHEYFDHENQKQVKDAVQVRVIYGNGNILKATSKFDVFNQWRELIIDFPELDASLFEQTAQLLEAHPIPNESAIKFWVKAFSDRREQLSKLDTNQKESFKESFIDVLTKFIENFWQTNGIYPSKEKEQKEADQKRDQQLKTWFKLAAFIKRNRTIKLGQELCNS